MTTTYDYSAIVYRTLLPRELVAGVSRASLFIVIVITYFGMVELRLPWFIAVGALIYVILRKSTKADEYLVDIILNSLLVPDTFHAY